MPEKSLLFLDFAKPTFENCPVFFRENGYEHGIHFSRELGARDDTKILTEAHCQFWIVDACAGEREAYAWK